MPGSTDTQRAKLARISLNPWLRTLGSTPYSASRSRHSLDKHLERRGR